MSHHIPSRAHGRPRLARRLAALLLSGLFCAAVPLPVQATQERTDAATAARDPIDAHVAEAAKRFSIPAAWIRAVMHVESTGDRVAVSPKGAMGLMQIMPATWDYLSARHALGRDPFDPRANILAGAAYLRELHDRYGSPGFLAAYNAGPGRYEASLNGRALPAETLRYVAMLAPVLGDAAPGGALELAAVDPLAWTRAPLFARRGNDRPADRSVLPEREESSVSYAAAGMRDISASVPQAGGLFVGRRAGGEVR